MQRTSNQQTVVYYDHSDREGLAVTLEEKVHNGLKELEPRLEELAEGHAELLEADPEHGRVTLKLIGGRLN